MPELRLAIVGLYPYLLLNKRDDLGTRTYQLPGADLTFSDNSGLGGDDPGVAQVRPHRIESSLPSLKVRVEHLLLRIKHGTLPTLGLQFPAAAFYVRTCATQVGLAARELRAGRVNLRRSAGALRLEAFLIRDRLFKLLPCCRLRCYKCFLAFAFEGGASNVRFCRHQCAPGVRKCRISGVNPRFRRRDFCFSRNYGGLCLPDSGILQFFL